MWSAIFHRRDTDGHRISGLIPTLQKWILGSSWDLIRTELFWHVSNTSAAKLSGVDRSDIIKFASQDELEPWRSAPRRDLELHTHRLKLKGGYANYINRDKKDDFSTDLVSGSVVPYSTATLAARSVNVSQSAVRSFLDAPRQLGFHWRSEGAAYWHLPMVLRLSPTI
jgi:hypothetical protein